MGETFSENGATFHKQKLEVRKEELKRLEQIETHKTAANPTVAGNAERLRQELMTRHRNFILEHESKES